MCSLCGMVGVVCSSGSQEHSPWSSGVEGKDFSRLDEIRKDGKHR